MPRGHGWAPVGGAQALVVTGDITGRDVMGVAIKRVSLAWVVSTER